MSFVRLPLEEAYLTPMVPFLIAAFVVLLAVTYWPALSLALPKALGF